MKEKAVGARRRKYDASFKEEVLKMVFNGRAVSEVAQRLGVGENLIYRWKSRYKAKALASIGETATGPVVASEAEQALRRRIGELEVERDILKKALAIFSRQT